MTLRYNIINIIKGKFSTRSKKLNSWKKTVFIFSLLSLILEVTKKKREYPKQNKSIWKGSPHPHPHCCHIMSTRIGEAKESRYHRFKYSTKFRNEFQLKNFKIITPKKVVANTQPTNNSWRPRGPRSNSMSHLKTIVAKIWPSKTGSYKKSSKCNARYQVMHFIRLTDKDNNIILLLLLFLEKEQTILNRRLPIARKKCSYKNGLRHQKLSFSVKQKWKTFIKILIWNGIQSPTVIPSDVSTG